MKRQPLWVACRYGVGVATICVGILSLFVQPAAAATATATLTVSANVISSCTVTNGTLAFGDYAPTAHGQRRSDRHVHRGLHEGHGRDRRTR